ncbi:sensor histidine kinase [uncultured Sulfitobacter sp.]|uniref:sensor histidine kinase n=1 Tax=uncultured Sulfitobacter sp. TaxID=191468 RepID=UPI00260E2DB8|nr:sensor histidine kinase [uncultured Sulfitobacter sp.]
MKENKWYNGLRFQIVVLMSVALLPLGAIAVYQTNRVEVQAKQNDARIILAVTADSAKTQGLTLERAKSVVDTLAIFAADLSSTPNKCQSELSSILAAYPAGSDIVIRSDGGRVICRASINVSGGASVASTSTAFEDTERVQIVKQQTEKGLTSFYLVQASFLVNGTIGGVVSISVPQEDFPVPENIRDDLALIDLLVFTPQTDTMPAQSGTIAGGNELPKDLSLLQQPNDGLTFTSPNRDGDPRIYTVISIVDSPLAILGIWRQEESLAQVVGDFIKPAIFPTLMWFGSMAVALLSIYTLVLRHLSRIRRNMDAFSKDRKIDQGRPQVAMPNELRALSGNYDRLTDDIMREEARLEDTLREKNVLIKEVHHRVKNNLQLIASIMNMQIRTAKQPETKAVLSRVQDRVLSLATIHRNLYQTQAGGRVDAGNLVAEIVQKSASMGIAAQDSAHVETDIDPVMLYPDQAVPLSLLVAEAVTNAVKHLGTGEDRKPELTVSLKQTGDQCSLAVTNSIGAHDPQDSTGLGSELMNAFVLQLGGALTTKKTVDNYSFAVTFTVEKFEPEMRDF